MWKKFSIRILIFTPLIVLLIGGLNFMVDPYDIFDSPKIEGLNTNKPEVDTHLRIYKAIRLQQLKPQTIFIGTSRTEEGIDPTNKNIKTTAYNAAISSGLPAEYEYYIDSAIKNGAKEVFIGVDLFTFYARDHFRPDFDKTAFEKFEPAKYILSRDAFTSSLKTIGNKKLSIYLQTGMRDPVRLQNECDEKNGHKKIFQNSEDGYFKTTYSKGFNKAQTAHWQAFERILDKAHKKGVKITLFISPSHARQWEVLAITQGWEMFEEYRRRLIAVNEDVAIRNGKEAFVLWDFAGYHTLTTESVPDDPKARMRWYWDSSHYKKELGDIVLDRMFDGNFSGGKDYPDFGVKLTTQNIEQHLAKLRAERARWRATHPVDVAEIEALKK